MFSTVFSFPSRYGNNPIFESTFYVLLVFRGALYPLATVSGNVQVVVVADALLIESACPEQPAKEVNEPVVVQEP